MINNDLNEWRIYIFPRMRTLSNYNAIFELNQDEEFNYSVQIIFTFFVGPNSLSIDLYVQLTPLQLCE